MTDGARLTETPAGIRLGSIDDIVEGRARNYVVQLRAGRFHGFVVRHGGTVHGYVDRCPHAGVTLARTLDDYLTPAGDLIACSWHGALFTLEEGRCVGGPCVGQSLIAWPVQVRRATIVTLGSRRQSAVSRLARRLRARD